MELEDAINGALQVASILSHVCQSVVPQLMDIYQQVKDWEKVVAEKDAKLVEVVKKVAASKEKAADTARLEEKVKKLKADLTAKKAKAEASEKEVERHRVEIEKSQKKAKGFKTKLEEFNCTCTKQVNLLNVDFKKQKE